MWKEPLSKPQAVAFSKIATLAMSTHLSEAPVSYAQVEATPDDIRALVGETVWSAFYTTAVNEECLIPRHLKQAIVAAVGQLNQQAARKPEILAALNDKPEDGDTERSHSHRASKAAAARSKRTSPY